MASLFVEDMNDRSLHLTIFAETITTEDIIVGHPDTGPGIHSEFGTILSLCNMAADKISKDNS